MDNHTSFKCCSKCGVEYPATAEYFYKTQSGGLRNSCKKCRNNYVNQWSQDNRDRSRAIKNRWDDNHRDSIQKWRAENAEYLRQYNKRYYAANKEQCKLKGQKWLAQNTDKARSIKRAYYDRNRQQVISQAKNWKQSHPESDAVSRHKRRAKLKAAEGEYTKADIVDIYQQQDGRCLYCGIPVFWDIKNDLHIDHIVPLARGGSNYPINLCIACFSCNSSKQHKLISEWELMRGW